MVVNFTVNEHNEDWDCGFTLLQTKYSKDKI